MRASWTLLQAKTALKPRVSNSKPTPYSWVQTRSPGPATGRLAGRAIAIKDNISFTEAPSSCSSDMLKGLYPPYTATCVSSLLSEGAHIVGQTKMDEFGMGSQTTHLPPTYTPVHNPSGPQEAEPRSTGGSSGGSAAAVAEGSCWAALGTDTGGSVRLPASYCGVVGLKPSYGMISRHGIVSYADSLDCVGILAKKVADVQEVYDVVSRPDDRDMTCVTTQDRASATNIAKGRLSQMTSTADKPLQGLRIGIPRQLLLPKPHIQVPSALLDFLQGMGATLHTVDLRSLKMALPAYYVLASAEASSNLARYGGGWFGSKDEGSADGTVETGAERRKRVRTKGFGGEVKKRLLAGTWALSADEFNNTYLKALHLRRTLRKDFNQNFRIPHPLHRSSAPADGVDIMLHPTAIRTAPRLSETKTEGSNEYLQDLLTVPASLAGLPAMSVPVGKAEDGWPVGMSIVGQWGMEEMIFHAGRVMEKWASH